MQILWHTYTENILTANLKFKFNCALTFCLLNLTNQSGHMGTLRKHPCHWAVSSTTVKPRGCLSCAVHEETRWKVPQTLQVNSHSLKRSLGPVNGWQCFSSHFSLFCLTWNGSRASIRWPAQSPWPSNMGPMPGESRNTHWYRMHP